MKRHSRPLTAPLGEVVGAQLTAALAQAAVSRAREESRASWAKVAEVARQLGADLCDREHFEICQQLAG